MEIFDSPIGYIVVDRGHALFCYRNSAKLVAKRASFLHEIDNPRCLGQIYGVIGRLSLNAGQENYLLVVTRCRNIGAHPFNGKTIFKIEQIAALALFSAAFEFSTPNSAINNIGYYDAAPNICSNLPTNFDVCSKHASPSVNAANKRRTTVESLNFLQKPKNLMKSTTDSLKFMSEQMNNLRGRVSGNEEKDTPSTNNSAAKNSKILLDEILKLFNENGCMYFSDGDLTNCVQKLAAEKSPKFDDRFFWNRALLSDLLLSDDDSSMTSSSTNGMTSSLDFAANEEAKFWIKPVIQGYVEILPLDFILDSRDVVRPHSAPTVPTVSCSIMLISRRSVHRAGTRYIKRGIDENGNCANFVETEQILTISDHLLSFVQIRASIPLFWRQPGYKYRPPPRLYKSRPENLQAMTNHFRQLFESYGDSLIVINLIDQSGREKILGDAFMDHMLAYDSDRVTFAAFDFHEHCRGLKFENVDILMDALAPESRSMRFCWLDKRRECICRQTAVFRVNCVDCLDRTNVAQATLARRTLELQLRKLGLLSPDEYLDQNSRRTVQTLWANNGDAISRQYAGTAALKGDFTRTGQRNLAGIVRDGYNSASRYYMSHLKDHRRQAAIDALLGIKTQSSSLLEPVTGELMEPELVEDETENAAWSCQKDEHLRLLVLDCEKLVIPEDEALLAGWALIDVDSTDYSDKDDDDDMDTVVMLTRNAYYVADYNDQLDEFVDFERVPLANVQKVELGQLVSSGSTTLTLFHHHKSSPKAPPCIRVWYKLDDGDSGYFHTWKSAGTRLFNNLAVSVKSPEEYEEYTNAIFEQFRNALTLSGVADADSIAKRVQKLDRKKSKIPPAKQTGRRNFGQIFSTLFNPNTKSRLKSIGRLSIVPPSKSKANRLLKPIIISEETGSSSKWTNSTVFTSSDYFRNDVGLIFSHADLAEDVKFLQNSSETLPRRFSEIPELAKLDANLLGKSASGLKFESPSICVSPVVDYPSGSSQLLTPVSTTASANLLPAADKGLTPATSLKVSRSESSLKSTAGSAGIEKSSSSVVLEKLAGGRRFLQSVGQQFQGTFSKKSTDHSQQASAVGHSKNVVNVWRDFEDRIKLSKTKFILL